MSERPTPVRLTTRRIFMVQAAGTALALLGPSLARAAETIKAVRAWPAQDYTRLTFESAAALRFEVQTLKGPDRLVLDLDGVDYGSVAQELVGKLQADDPYISGVRTGRFTTTTTRVVLDLRTEVKPQIFQLKPVGEYEHRLVIDVYPANPPDPLIALLQRRDRSERPADATAPAEPAAPEEPKTETAARAPGRRQRDNLQRTLTIVVDAGHGGEDPGARGRRGTNEKTVTLAIARRLKALIDEENGYRAVLTRDGDYFIPLQMRVEKARRVRADLFVSVHADAFVDPQARGSSVFALSERGATSTAARWLARRENEADMIGGVNLASTDRNLAQTLLDLSQRGTIDHSLKLGRHVLTELGGINRLHKDYVEQAGFAVLKSPDIPSILVETAFISNPDEERRLADDRYQDRMARALLTGIKKYFAKHPPAARSTFA